MTSAALAQVTMHCKTARATMGWPDWGKQGLEMISQQVHSYSATNVTHTPIQVIWRSNWLLKQWKLAEMDNSHINHLTISTPVLPSHLQLLCFPLFTLNEQLSTEPLSVASKVKIQSRSTKGSSSLVEPLTLQSHNGQYLAYYGLRIINRSNKSAIRLERLGNNLAEGSMACTPGSEREILACNSMMK